MTITITTGNLLSKAAPLFVKRDGQPKPQPAHLYLDSKGNVWAGVSYNPGPTKEWRFVRWPLAPEADGESLAKVITSKEVIDLLEQVYIGTEWGADGCVINMTAATIEAHRRLWDLLGCHTLAPDDVPYSLCQPQ